MRKPVNVLIVEDSDDDAKLALLALRHGGFDPTHRRVQTAAELERALAEERWDAVISDYNLPGFTGVDALMIFRSTGLDIPFILVSGTMGEETAVKAMKAGASDYVMKSSLARLAPALERELEEAQMRAAHRRAQEALTDSEMRFRQMAESIRDVIFLRDADDNRMLYISPAYEEIWGRSCESAYADPESWIEAIHPDDRVSADEKYRKAMSSGTFEYEYRIVRPDGAIRWIEARGFPVRDDAGRIVRIAGVAEDITEQKRAKEQIQRYVAQIENAFMSTVQVVTTLGEMRDPYTAGHQRRVAEIAVAIGAELGFDAHRQEGLRVAGYLHDIGKMRIPSEILSKPGKLSPIEFQLVQGHAQASYEALKDVEFPWPVAEIALQHHERMDGSGYPQGLTSEAILLEARIIAVADVIEAMSSHRPYRAGLGTEAALAEIERGRGSAYDTAVADACLKLFREKGNALPA